MGGCGLLASKVSTFNQKYLNTTLPSTSSLALDIIQKAEGQERITSVPTANSDWPTEQPAVSQLTRRDGIDVVESRRFIRFIVSSSSKNNDDCLWANFLVEKLYFSRPTDRPTAENKRTTRERKEEYMMKIFFTYVVHLFPETQTCESVSISHRFGVQELVPIAFNTADFIFSLLSESLQASIFVLGLSLQKEQQQQQQPEKRKSIFTKPEEALREKSSPSSVAAIFFFTKQHAFNSCGTSIIDCLPGMCRRRV
ncbi:hypothetical protein T02_12417 [Trichinella nativa]|uniref:Uncharacterized protein n=1 Tax=Trichinella nativa TaxID=6335 RepID=A0A0V1L0S1_9BILA|nr:hypothetical protein T02_12417 [Trichinella nativa]